MIGLIIFWIGMYLLLEIIIFINIEHTISSRLLFLSLDDSLGHWLKILTRLILLVIFTPLVSLYACYHWIKQ